MRLPLRRMVGRLKLGLALLVVLLCSPAAAERWAMQFGQCNEWTARLDLQTQQSGVWVGRMDQTLIGGPCAAGTFASISSDIRIAIVGDEFFAVLLPYASPQQRMPLLRTAHRVPRGGDPHLLGFGWPDAFHPVFPAPSAGTARAPVAAASAVRVPLGRNSPGKTFAWVICR
jgi:hypothetical protein